MTCFNRLSSLFMLLAVFTNSSNAQTSDPYIYICKGATYTAIKVASEEFVFSDDRTSFAINGYSFNISEIDSISFEKPSNLVADTGTTVIDGDTVYIVYTDEGAQVKVPSQYASDVTAVINGGDVALTSTASGTEVIYSLSGHSSAGSFTFTGSYKATFVLNGLDLTSTSGAAIDIECGKRIAIELAEGTDNYLTDAGNGGQKACLYTKGHLELSKGGSLTIKGNTKHAIASKEYCLVKKTIGSITVTGAVSDGIHAGQYFKMNGGTVKISGTGGDGIQAECTDDSTDTDNGQLMIAGGTLDIATTGDAAKALKCDSLLTVSGGTLTLTLSGSKTVEGEDASYSTGMKTDGDISITGGTITINNSADGGKGISADGNVNIADGEITITSTGAGGTYEAGETEDKDEADAESFIVYVHVPTNGSSQGGGGGFGGFGGWGQQTTTPYWSNVYLYKSDGTKVATLTKSVNVSSSAGSTLLFYYYDFGEAVSGTYYFASDNYTSSSRRPGGSSSSYAIKSGTFSAPTGTDSYYSISESYSTSSGTMTFSLSNVTTTYSGGTKTSGSSTGTVYAAAGIKSDGNVSVSGGTVEINHSGAMSKGINCDKTVTVSGGELTFETKGASQVYNSDAKYCTAIKSNDFVQTAGSITVTATGLASRGISVDNDMNISGGTNTITCSGAGGTISSSDSYASRAYAIDGNLSITGGNHTLKATGTGGKGIRVGGTAVFGEKGNDGPVMNVTTTGSYVTTSSGGMGGMGGGMDSGGSGSAKAIKVTGAATINSGDYKIYTSTDGSEGIESKSTLTVNGGDIYIKAYDDCINSSAQIIFNGGRTYCYSTKNDAIDSNYGRSGAITFNDGVVIALSAAGAPEEGIDADNNSYLTMNGGYVFSAGANQGGGGGGWGSSSGLGSASQAYCLLTSSVSYATGRYYTIANSSGTNIFTFTVPASLSSSLSLISAPTMTSGNSYSIKYSTTAPTDATSEFNGFYFGSSAVGTSSVTSFTATK